MRRATKDLGAEFTYPIEFTDIEMHENINKSDLMICDVSDSDGDTLYGFGYANALSKPVIIICRHDSPSYDPKSLIESFYEKIKKEIQSAIKNPENWIYSHERHKIMNKNLFISYSHNDKNYLDRLLVHLKPLEREDIIDLWVDTKLLAGDKWKIEIEASLKRARVAILLVSADFLASDFIVNNELPPLLKASEAKGTRIIPFIITPCRFLRDKNLSSFQAINDPKHPLIKMDFPEQEELYNKVSELVESYFIQRSMC